jgi:hypothetical protein
MIGNHQNAILKDQQIAPPGDPEGGPAGDRVTGPAEDREIAPMGDRAADLGVGPEADPAGDMTMTGGVPALGGNTTRYSKTRLKTTPQ